MVSAVISAGLVVAAAFAYLPGSFAKLRGISAQVAAVHGFMFVSSGDAW